MRVPLSWLRQYVDVDLPVQELAHRLTMAGIEVGEVEVIGGWKEVFVGHVTDVRPHPNADRLRLCVVTTGAEELEVVCGAPNVASGQKKDSGKRAFAVAQHRDSRTRALPLDCLRQVAPSSFAIRRRSSLHNSILTLGRLSVSYLKESADSNQKK